MVARAQGCNGTITGGPIRPRLLNQCPVNGTGSSEALITDKNRGRQASGVGARGCQIIHEGNICRISGDSRLATGRISMTRGIKIISLAILWLAPTLIFSRAFTQDWYTTWHELRVPAWKDPFLDLRSITSAIRVQQRGGDPFLANPDDVGKRPINYPRIWLQVFKWLGINDGNLAIAGISFCVLYLSCISWLVASSKSAAEALLLLIAGLSLAPLFGIERGNIDLFVFSVVFLGCTATNKYLKPGAFFCAAMLKLFPFAAVCIDVARRPSKERRVPLLFAALALALLALQWRDLNAIRHSTPVATYLSYGVLTVRAQEQQGYLSGSVFAAGWAIAILTVVILLLRRPKIDDAMLRSKAGEMFLIFGGIYALTFAIGSNWDYRLIFLLPTLPFAMELARGAEQAKWGISYIAAVLLAENSFGIPYESILLGDLATFIVFAIIAVISLPVAMRFFGEVKGML